MASTYKVLGQASPSANTDTNLYVVPVSKSVVISTLTICNRNTSNGTSMFRIAIVPNGETLSNKHYIAYEQFIDSRKSIDKTLGLSLAAGDTVVVRSDTTDLSFSLFGAEIS